MISLKISEDRTIWLSIIGSLLIHGLLFAFSGKTFIQHAQFSLQPSAQRVEVSILDHQTMRSSSFVILSETKDLKMPLDSSALPQNDIKPKQTIHFKSGVRVKANPDYFQNPSPDYPELAKQMRQEGLVMLSVDVGSAGDPVKVEIIQSSGFRLLDQAAFKAVRHWKFQPGRIGDISVESTVTVPIRFSLEK